jgi:hypothetical protein
MLPFIIVGMVLLYAWIVHSGPWDYQLGRVQLGIGWWAGSAKVFACTRQWYDGYWYGFRLGPFWLCVEP